jgi:large subunit ribosomal protein L23
MGFLKKLLTKKSDNDAKKTEKVSVVKKAKETKAVTPVIIKEEKKTVEMAVKSKTEIKKRQTISTGLAQRVLLYPLVTEKSAIAESENKYSFVAVNWATKKQIKAAVLELYDVEPVAVNTVNYDGHYVAFRGKLGKRKDYKKAIVTLPTGKTIDIHKGV